MPKKVISKQELIHIASQIIKEQGLESCSIRAVARNAGVAVGTIYNYFSSHRTLLEELFFNSWKLTLEKLQPIAIEDITPEKKIELFANTLKSDIQDRKGLGRELFGMSKFSEKLCDSHKEIFKSIVEIIYLIISESPKNKKCKQDNLIMISRWILMIIIDSVTGNGSDFNLVIPELKERFI